MAALDLKPSSNIASADYDAEAKVLTVTFKNGGTYKYSAVPQEIADGFAETNSPGKYFAANIRGKFDGVKQ